MKYFFKNKKILFKNINIINIFSLKKIYFILMSKY